MFWKKKKISELYSGERETGISLFEITKHSIYRYNLVRESLTKYFNNDDIFGLDIFCGNGYGAYFLAKYSSLSKILAIDGCKDAIKQAKNYYKNEKIIYKHNVFPFSLPKSKFDFVVCFESLEHLDNQELFLNEINKTLKKDSILFLSTPNKDFFPSSEEQDKFHKKIYSRVELENQLISHNFDILDKYGQNVFKLDTNGKIISYLPKDERIITKNLDSQHQLYICRKK